MVDLNEGAGLLGKTLACEQKSGEVAVSSWQSASLHTTSASEAAFLPRDKRTFPSSPVTYIMAYSFWVLM